MTKLYSQTTRRTITTKRLLELGVCAKGTKTNWDAGTILSLDNIPASYKLGIVLTEDLIEPMLKRKFAMDCAKESLEFTVDYSERIQKIIAVKQRHINGNADDAEFNRALKDLVKIIRHNAYRGLCNILMSFVTSTVTRITRRWHKSASERFSCMIVSMIMSTAIRSITKAMQDKPFECVLCYAKAAAIANADDDPECLSDEALRPFIEYVLDEKTEKLRSLLNVA